MSERRLPKEGTAHPDAGPTSVHVGEESGRALRTAGAGVLQRQQEPRQCLVDSIWDGGQSSFAQPSGDR